LRASPAWPQNRLYEPCLRRQPLVAGAAPAPRGWARSRAAVPRFGNARHFGHSGVRRRALRARQRRTVAAQVDHDLPACVARERAACFAEPRERLAARDRAHVSARGRRAQYRGRRRFSADARCDRDRLEPAARELLARCVALLEQFNYAGAADKFREAQ